jgi:hypothetical protein
MTHSDTCDIGNRVERARLVAARHDPEITSPLSGFIGNVGWVDIHRP